MTATDSTTDADPSTNGGPQRRGFGIDVGGSGVKGGIVDLDTGQLIGDRFKLLTPQPATPEAVAKTIAEVVNGFGWTGPLGVTYPGVVTHGSSSTAANVDKAWIGANARDVISSELGGQDVTVLNDADAAGLAEEKLRRGQGPLRLGRAADLRHRHRLGGHSQRDAAFPTPNSAISRSAAKRPSSARRHRSKRRTTGATRSGPSR